MASRRVAEVAEELGLSPEVIVPYGPAAKVPLEAAGPPRGRLVAVSAITPTPAGEGKTTVSVALAMGLRRAGRSAVPCLREPSLGPVFGIKGGGTGGGRATLEPASVIDLHFTGDLHAVGSAHNLLAALVDNDLHFGATSGLDPAGVTFPRVVDMNDRALRHIVVGLSGDGVARESRFDITAASEVMATLCLAESLPDLRARLGRIVVGARRDGSFVTAGDLEAAPAMTALLREALLPNLAQTAEGGPAIVHGGPFANIAHGCSSVLGTRLGLAHADICVTEGGFGFDLGGEKLLQIKCRSARLWPSLVVLVVTLRALRVHGGAPLARASEPGPDALREGLANLDAHLDAIDAFGLPAVVAVNRFHDDPEGELAIVRAHAEQRRVPAAVCDGFARGGEGARELADRVVTALEAAPPARPRFLYELDAPYADKIEAIATRIYGARGVHVSGTARRQLEAFERAGHGGLAVCVAKTHRSLSDVASARGRPRDFEVTVREARLAAGAGFVVAQLGDVSTMPGLPRVPAARGVTVDDDGTIHGLWHSGG